LISVLVSTFTSAEGASRQVLRRVLNSEAEALVSLPLFVEYEAVLGRPETQRRCPLTATEQSQLLDAFLSRTRIVELYYRWTPNSAQRFRAGTRQKRAMSSNVRWKPRF
jgi:hypothetical protein